MKTETLIAELSQQTFPVRKRLSYRRVCVEWVTVTCISFIVNWLIQGIREDIFVQLNSSLFITELMLNILLIVVAGFAAIRSAYPDRAHSPYIKTCIYIIFTGYSLLIIMLGLSETNLLSLSSHVHGIACFRCILSFTLLPALWMFWRLRQLATVTPAYAGGVALMMAVATGCLGVRFVETEIASKGLIYWHYFPLLFISVLGLMMGKKIFRW